MSDVPEQVSLYRVYTWDHSQAWACTIEEDPDSPSGYRILDLDPKVADYWFLDRLEQHMRSTVVGTFSEERPGGIIVSGEETLRPGDPGHFDTAARTVQNAWVGPPPGRE